MRIDYDKCFGCSACACACPTHAIKMERDERGFQYPNVDNKLCIDCGKCERVCIYMNSKINNVSIKKSYAFIHNDKKVLSKCASGGLFLALSDVILSRNGVIYGAVLDDKMRINHSRATTKQERDLMCGSKYVQSNLGDTFICAKKDLQAGKYVLFTGTPCQIDGLKSYLKGIDIEKLYTCDLICNGVPSPLIWEENIKLLERKYRKKVEGYQFRPKKWGWSVHREIVNLKNHKDVYATFYSDLFKNIYYGRLVMRKSCDTCPYTNLARVGDITMGDCRNVEKIYPQMQTFNGVSLAIINSKKGMDLFTEASENAKIFPVDIEKIKQPPMMHPGKPSKSSEIFWNDYKHKGYEYAVKHQYGKMCVAKYILKKILHKN